MRENLLDVILKNDKRKKMLRKRKLYSLVLLIVCIMEIVPILNIYSIPSLEINKTLDSYDSNLKGIGLSNQGYINFSNQKLFWFIHLTDTQYVWQSNCKIEKFYQFLNESYNTIKPLFIYNTGDLVNGINGILHDKEEWEKYKKALEDNDINSSNYMDLIGNHDASMESDYSYFLNYSIMGRNYNTTQYSFNHSFSFGNYAFIGLNTAKKSDYTFLDYPFFGFLDTQRLDWYENELEKYKDFDKIFLFCHHPISYSPLYSIISDLSSSGKNFEELNDEYNVFCHLSGHIHIDSFQRENNLLMFTTRNFDKNNGTYRIISIDNNQLSTSIEYVGKWPQGVITYPPNEDYVVETLENNDKKIRVLAWDPKGITSVKWSIYSIYDDIQISKWYIMKPITINNLLWESDWNLPHYGKFLLKVKIEGESGVSIKQMVISSNKVFYFIIFVKIFVVIILYISIAILLTYYLNNYFQIFKKKKKIPN